MNTSEQANTPVVEETLLHRLRYWARQKPNDIFLSQPFPDGSVLHITWKQAWHQVRQFAAWLEQQELPAGSSIALLGRNSAHWMLADAGIWLAGHVTVPLFTSANAKTVNYTLAHCNAKLLVLGRLDGIADSWNQIKAELPAELPMVGLPLSPTLVITQWDEIVSLEPPLQQPAMPKRDQLATIIYTSGSTGQPKGVMHSFGTMMAFCESLGQLYKMDGNDRMLSYLPLAHAAERAGIESMGLYFGIHIFFSNGLETFQADLKRARPTFFLSVPRLWIKFYLGIQSKLPPKLQRVVFATPILSGMLKRYILKALGMDAIRVAVTGSAPLSPEIQQWYRDLGLQLLDCYGMSENFATSHSSRPEEVRSAYSGTPAPDVSCRISPEGEVLVRSPGQMLGYYKEPQLTADSMTEDGFFRTGDRGVIDEIGRLRITGRVKELFKTSKGKYVAPAPIEQLLSTSSDIDSVCVTGPEHPQPFALITLSDSVLKALQQGTLTKATVTTSLEQLRTDANEQLEKHEQLGYFVVLQDSWTTENGFLTPTLKIKRPTIESQFLPKADAWHKQQKVIVWD